MQYRIRYAAVSGARPQQHSGDITSGTLQPEEGARLNCLCADLREEGALVLSQALVFLHGLAGEVILVLKNATTSRVVFPTLPQVSLYRSKTTPPIRRGKMSMEHKQMRHTVT